VPWRATFITAAVVVATGLAAPVVARAEVAEWQATVLPLPTEYPDGQVQLTGTDGNGHYSGTLRHPGGDLSVVLYDGDRPVVAGAPRGCSGAYVSDENASGLVVGTAYNCEESIYEQAFVYQRGTFSLVTLPRGYSMAWSIAVNDRGAILAEVSAPDTTTPTATAVLSPVAAAPVVIQYTLEGQRPVDIDDGTVLFGSDAGPIIWKDGELTKLPVPDGYTGATVYARAGGHVVGSATSAATAEEVSLYWPKVTSVPRVLPGPGRPTDVNRSGLAVGNFPATTWQDGVPAGDLPRPKGLPYVSVVGVGGDGTVFGEGDTGAAPGIPVIWRRK
jgi:hypothetical protein